MSYDQPGTMHAVVMFEGEQRGGCDCMTLW